MKKILKSAITVSLVVVMLIGVTTAYFSDTETSEGNTFTTGSIDLKVDSTCLYNGEQSGECGTWSETDLTSEKFFNFDDLKPGDYGVNTISLHVYDNDAYACTIIDNMVDTDDSVTEPELEFDDAMVGAGYGELSQEVHFFAWSDDNNNNAWDADEQYLFSNVKGPASDVLDGVVYDLHTPATDTVMPGDTTQYLGVYWCYGNLTVDEGDNLLSCDGSGVTNLTQTDSLSADITFYVEQARNNGEFVCPSTVKKVLVLDNKDESWNPINDDVRGLLTFMSPYSTFNYELQVTGLTPNTSYTLINYVDPWPATGSTVIDAFITDPSGDAVVSGNVELGTDLVNAKIWVIPSAHWSGTEMTSWSPSMYLFEKNLVTYDDSDL